MNKCAFDGKDFDTADYVGEVRRLPPQNRFIDSDEIRVQIGVALLRTNRMITAPLIEKEIEQLAGLYCTRSGDKTRPICGECEPYGHCVGI